MKILDQMKEQEKKIQDSVLDKMKNGKAADITDAEAALYTLTEEDKEVMEIFKRIADGTSVPGFSFKDFLATPQASVLIPRVVIGTMRKAAEPMYLASQFYKKIRLKHGNAIMFPSIGVMKAHDVAEGQEIPQETINWQLHKSSLIKVGKSGVRVQVTEDLISDADWDIVGMLLQEAGRAMARHKEQKAFAEWLMHGWTVFDNELYKKNPAIYKEARTTGVDFKGDYNDTMSIDDFLDIIIAVYNNEYTPTDLVMHPLAWTVFAKNGLTGSMTAPLEREAKREMPNASFKLGPESIQGRIPFAFNVNLSPFAPIDKINKTFDMFCVDRNNVGVLIVQDDLKTEEFRDPSRDIRNVKIVERYGYGTYNEGRAICSAKNISMAKSWPMPERYISVDMPTPTP
jgi:hypothetical protein